MWPPEGVKESRISGAALLAFLLAVSLAFLGPGAQAAETEKFGFQPHPQEIDGEVRRGFNLSVPEGGAVRDAVLVFNKTDSPLTMRIYGADAARDEQGTVSVAPFGARSRDVGAWIRPDTDQVELPPNGREIVEFAVARPEGAEPGTGAIVAEEVPPEDRESAIQLVLRVALLVQVGEAEEGTPYVQIDDVGLLVPLRFVPSDGDVEVTVVNGTASTLRSRLQGRIRSLTGREYPLPPLDIEMEPGQQSTFTIQWNAVPRWGGFMKAEVSLEWEGGEASNSSGRTFVVPIWLLVLLAIALTVFLWWPIVKRLFEPPVATEPALPAQPGPPVEAQMAAHQFQLLLHKVDTACQRALDAGSTGSAAGFLAAATRHLNQASEIVESPGVPEEQRERMRQAYRAYGAAIASIKEGREGGDDAEKSTRSKMRAAARRMRDLQRI